MFHITVLAVGRLKERYLVEGTAEYLKRLAPYARVDVVEVDEAGFGESTAPSAQESQREGAPVQRMRRTPSCCFGLEKEAILGKWRMYLTGWPWRAREILPLSLAAPWDFPGISSTAPT